MAHATWPSPPRRRRACLDPVECPPTSCVAFESVLARSGRAAQLIAEGAQRGVLIGLLGEVRAARKLWFGQRFAHRDGFVVIASQRQDTEGTRFEHPDFADAESEIDLELVQRAARGHHLERKVRDWLVLTARVALVCLEPALFFLLAERGRAVAKERDVALEAIELEQSRNLRLRHLVTA